MAKNKNNENGSDTVEQTAQGLQDLLNDQAQETPGIRGPKDGAAVHKTLRVKASGAQDPDDVRTGGFTGTIGTGETSFAVALEGVEFRPLTGDNGARFVYIPSQSYLLDKEGNVISEGVNEDTFTKEQNLESVKLYEEFKQVPTGRPCAESVEIPADLRAVLIQALPKKDQDAINAGTAVLKMEKGRVWASYPRDKKQAAKS